MEGSTLDVSRHSAPHESFVLMESLDPGTRPEDVRERARALGGGGKRVRLVKVEPAVSESSFAPADAPAPCPATGFCDWGRALDSIAAESPRSTLVLAGASGLARAGEAAQRWRGAIRIWPTTLTGDRALDTIALDCAVAANVRSASARGALWDGDYVLVPGSVSGAVADSVIEAFADLADDASSLEVVILGEGSEARRRRAGELGVGWRAHWAGPAPLRAEQTWLAGATAVILTDREAARLPLVLRAMAAGVPLVIAGAGAAAASLHAWLAAHRAVATPHARETGAIAAALRAAIAGDEPVRAASARAAAFALARDAAAPVAILGERLPVASPKSRAA